MIRHLNLTITGIILAVTILLSSASYAAEKIGNDTVEALMLACLQGDVKKVKKLLSKGVDVNAKGPDGSTALIMATRSKHKEVVKILLENGANVNAQDNRGWTALMRASGKIPEIVELLVKAGADVNLGHNNGWKPIFRMLGGLEATKILVENGVDVNERNPSDSTVLMWASCIGPPEVVQFLLEKGADVNAKSSEGQTALADAVSSDYTPRRLEVVKHLLKHGADINAKDFNNLTPLMKALAVGHMEIAEFLRKKGAKGAPTNLLQAVYINNVDLTTAFIKKGQNVNEADKSGATPLMYACQLGHAHLVELLLKNGAKVNAANAIGRTPLIYACDNRVAVAYMVKRLLTGKERKQLSEFPHVGSRIARLLIAHKADINARAFNGTTPLITACQVGDYHTVKLLLEKGADIEAKDENGYTAIEYASEKEHILELLLEHKETQKK